MDNLDPLKDVFNKNSDHQTAMDRVLESGLSLEYIQRTEVFDRSYVGETALFRAVVQRKPVAIIQKLIDEGADESVRCGYGKDTPLLYSLQSSYPVHLSGSSIYPDSSVHWLMSFLQQTSNAPVDVGDRDGITPLHSLVDMMIRSQWNHTNDQSVDYEMVYLEQLLQNGANPFRRDKYGYTPRDLFMETAVKLKAPTKANAKINCLKMVEDCLVEDINHPRLMAVMMATQKRVGADSPLSELDPDILRMIVEMGALMTPDDIGEMRTEEVRVYVKAIMTKLQT